MRVAALVDDARSLIALGRALSRVSPSGLRCTFQHLATWEELREQAALREFDVAFVQPDFGRQDHELCPGLHELLQVGDIAAPGAIVPYLSAQSLPPTAWLQVITRHVSPIQIVGGVDDDPSSILRVLARSRSWQQTRGLLASEGERLSPEGQELILSAVAGWPPAARVERLAREMAVSPRTLRRRLTGLNTSPGRLLRWGRLFEARRLWEMGVTSTTRIALVVGVADAAALAHLSANLAGVRLHHVLSPTGEALLERASGTSPHEPL